MVPQQKGNDEQNDAQSNNDELFHRVPMTPNI
jgi:hypothetical protein